MPAEPKITLQKLLDLLGFSATLEEHHMEDGILLDVKTEDSGRLIGRVTEFEEYGGPALLSVDDGRKFAGSCARDEG